MRNSMNAGIYAAGEVGSPIKRHPIGHRPQPRIALAFDSANIWVADMNDNLAGKL